MIWSVSCYSFCIFLCKIWIVFYFLKSVYGKYAHSQVGDMERIIGMLLAGQTQRHDGRVFNVSHTVVGRLWQRCLDAASVVERAGRGRPRKTTRDRDGRFIVKISKRRRFEFAKTLNAHCQDVSGAPPTIDPRTHETKIDIFLRSPNHSISQIPVCPVYRRVKVLY